MNNEEAIKTLEYFESNLDEASSAFIAWVCFLLSRSVSLTGELSSEYVNALSNVPEFLNVCERNAQITYVLLFCHIIEKRKDSFSLYKLNPNLFKTMVEDKHKESLDLIKKARDEIFAHKGKKISSRNLPSLINTKALFKDIFDFFSRMNTTYNRPNLVLETIFNNGFFEEDFEKIITLLNPERNKNIDILRKYRIGNFLKIS